MRDINGRFVKGINLTEEEKAKLKGNIPWNKGKKGVQIGWNKGMAQSEETKKKNSNSHRGLTPWNKGIPQSDEAKKKNSESHKGITAWNKGKSTPEETKQKISESCKGRDGWNKGKGGYKTKPCSEERKHKISEANKGNKNRLGQTQSEETKRKIGEANRIKMTGTKQSEETIKKRSEAMKGKNTYRRSSETRLKMSIAKQGDKSPTWNGGTSFEPYCPKFNNQLRKKIKERDDYQCQMPGCLCTQLDSLALRGRRLSVHHIHYDKPNCAPDLITLCIVCNNKANFNRDHYEALFMSKLRERGLIE